MRLRCPEVSRCETPTSVVCPAVSQDFRFLMCILLWKPRVSLRSLHVLFCALYAVFWRLFAFFRALPRAENVFADPFLLAMMPSCCAGRGRSNHAGSKTNAVRATRAAVRHCILGYMKALVLTSPHRREPVSCFSLVCRSGTVVSCRGGCFRYACTATKSVLSIKRKVHKSTRVDFFPCLCFLRRL